MSDSSRKGVIAGLPAGTFPNLLLAIDGLRNLRAFAALMGCMAAGVLVAGFFSLLATRLGFVFGFLGALSIFVAGALGISSAGVLLMDQARGRPSRTLREALVTGLECIPKFLLLALTLLAVAVVVLIGIAAAYLVCLIPVLGPMLFVVVFPLSVVVAGVVFCALFLCMFMALPAIWEDAPILGALTQALAIARSRLVESLLMLAVVGLLASAVALSVFAVLFTGLVPTVAMAASLFGGDALGSMVGGLHIGNLARDGGSYGLAAGIGGMLLWALIGSVASLVSLLGLDIIYLRVAQGIDVGATEVALRQRLDEARRQASEFGQRAKDVAERARDQARSRMGGAVETSTVDTSAHSLAPVGPRTPAVSPAPPPLQGDFPVREAPPESTTPAVAVAKALTCPHCLSPVAAGDVYCGVCGYKL